MPLLDQGSVFSVLPLPFCRSQIQRQLLKTVVFVSKNKLILNNTTERKTTQKGRYGARNANASSSSSSSGDTRSSVKLLGLPSSTRRHADSPFGQRLCTTSVLSSNHPRI